MKLKRIHLAILPVCLTGACIPILELKSPETFTDKRVKTMQFDDACKLQAYFDAAPPRLEVANERTFGTTGGGTEAGEATYRLGPGAPHDKLVKILKQFYKDVPAWVGGELILIKSDFMRRVKLKQGRPGTIPKRVVGIPVVPTTAEIMITSGRKKLLVRYHPCVGELLLGRRTYALRRKLLGLPPLSRPRTPPARRAARPKRETPRARPAPPKREAPRARPAPPKREAPRARPAPPKREAPRARPAPPRREAPRARPAPPRREAPRPEKRRREPPRRRSAPLPPLPR